MFEITLGNWPPVARLLQDRRRWNWWVAHRKTIGINGDAHGTKVRCRGICESLVEFNGIFDWGWYIFSGILKKQVYPTIVTSVAFWGRGLRIGPDPWELDKTRSLTTISLLSKHFNIIWSNILLKGVLLLHHNHHFVFDCFHWLLLPRQVFVSKNQSTSGFSWNPTDDLPADLSHVFLLLDDGVSPRGVLLEGMGTINLRVWTAAAQNLRFGSSPGPTHDPDLRSRPFEMIWSRPLEWYNVLVSWCLVQWWLHVLGFPALQLFTSPSCQATNCCKATLPSCQASEIAGLAGIDLSTFSCDLWSSHRPM